jgi:hypothetical protein
VSRSYLVGSWLNADEYDYTGYSGEMLMGHRNGASREVPHFTASGNANVAKYGDNDLTPKTSKVSIKDKILPQFKRLQTLQSQMVELETEYKTTDMSISEYSVLRDVLVAKLQRQEVLYKRAISAKPIKTEDEYEEVGEEYTYSSSDVEYTDTPTVGGHWLDDLNDKNSLKKPLQKTLQVVRTLVRLSHKARSYWQELKEV